MDKQQASTLLSRILTIRIAEEQIVKVYGSEQEMRCPVHLCIGQEAMGGGVCAALEKTDKVFSHHRSHGHYLGKGGDLKRFFAEIYGKKEGCCEGRGGSMHLLDREVGFEGSTPIVANTVPVSLGSAFASKYRDEKTVVVIFVGDAATEEGVVQECYNYAVLEQLPILFVCENNSFSVYTPLSERQSEHRKRLDIAKAYGLKTAFVDGNDAIGVFSKTTEILEDIRNGGGPWFIEGDVYRWREHCGPNYDFNLGYRPEEEFLDVKENSDPVKLLEDALVSSGILTLEEVSSLKTEILKKVEEAQQFGKEAAFPEKEDLVKFVYAQPYDNKDK